jgi:glycerol-3-phosphate dehydrogenase (NAD(P)+)
MRASIIGAGSFGTAIAQVISTNASEVLLFGRDTEVLRSINSHHVNPKYHPFVKLNTNVRAFDLARDSQRLQESDVVIFSTPSGATRQVSRSVNKYLKDQLIISTAKGVELPSRSTMSRVINQETGNHRIFSFSGPTLADELIHGFFSCATLGIDQEEHMDAVTKLLPTPNFILDFSHDVEGVEWCGILKNVYAIATGIFDSTIAGNNEHYGFLSLCYKEMKRILDALSSDNDLASKFCAFGDLNLTANVDKSRNRIFGFIAGKLWVTPGDIRSDVVVEGAKAAEASRITCDALGVDAPIVSFVNSCLDSPERIRENLHELIWQS